MEIKLARTRLGLSQKVLAENLGINSRRFVDIENKKSELEKMSIKKFVKLCEVLDEEFRNNVLCSEYLLTTFGNCD